MVFENGTAPAYGWRFSVPAMPARGGLRGSLLLHGMETGQPPDSRPESFGNATHATVRPAQPEA